MNYIYFELKTSGTKPLFSRITRLDVLLCDSDDTASGSAGSFRVKSFRPSGLFEEHRILKEFAELVLESDAVACPNEASLQFLRDCFKQYFIKDPFEGKEFIDPDIDIDIETFEGELKHFYPDYKNYYYFPLEDAAYHKSVAVFADKSARIKATPQTAYIKRAGTFVPAPNSDPSITFRKEYDSSETFVLLSDAGPSVRLHALMLKLSTRKDVL